MSEVKISSLPVANTLSANDRVVVLVNPAANASVRTTSIGNVVGRLAANVIPAAGNTYSLGNSTNAWQSLYVSSNTIFIGNTPLSVANGQLFVNSSPVSGGGAANTGNITFSGVQIIGAGNNSGDGNGFSTIELVPDSGLYENDQYLVIDPTVPSHIHIRAGGTQDNSAAQLFFGGEKNHVRVQDGSGVRIQNEFLIDNYWYYNSGSDFTAGSWFSNSSNHFVDFTTSNSEMISRYGDFTLGDPNELLFHDVNGTSTLTYAGSASEISPGVFRLQVNEAPPANPTAALAIEFRIFETRNNYLELQSNDFRVDVTDDIRMFSRDIFRLQNYSTEEPIEIITDADDNFYSWEFLPNGHLRTPRSIQLQSGIQEQVEGRASSSGVVEHNLNNAMVFYHTTPASNWTANFVNLVMPSDRMLEVKLVVSQGATGYYANAVQIEGVEQTINWKNNTLPTPSTNRTDIIKFSILYWNNTYSVFGELTGY